MYGGGGKVRGARW